MLPYQRHLATILAVIALCALAVRYATVVPDSVSASAPADVFSAERAMAHVEQIAQRPHPTGSADHARVRAYLLQQLTALGLTPQVQQATGVGTRYPIVGLVRNVVARVPGTQPAGGGQAVLLMAHYDGVPAGPAAADDGSGSAVLLETLRALRAGPPLLHDVIALFTDGEESGLHGAAAFAREHPWAEDAGVVLNFEARGTNGPSLMFETGAGNHDVVRVLRRVRGVRATSLSTTVYRQLPNDTDLSEMMALNRPAMNFAFIGGVQRYHTSDDDAAHLSRGSVQHHGNNGLGLARAFGNGPLPRPVTGDAVFFDFPAIGLIHYPVGWALPIAIVALALVVAAVARLRRREARWVKDLAIGAVGLVASLLLAGAIAIGASVALRALHAELANGGASEWSGVYGSAVAVLTIAIVAAGWAVVRRYAGAGGAYLGALAVLAVLSVVIAALMPGVSFLFTWPVMVAAVAAMLVPPLVWMSAVVTIFLFVPTVYLMVLVALGLDAAGATVLALFAAIGGWLLAPLLETVAGERRWRAAFALAAAATVLFVFGAATVRTDTTRPAGSSFVYAVDADSLTGWLTGSASTLSARRWMENALQGSVQQNLSVRPPAWLTRSVDRRRIVSAPVGAVTPPTVTLVKDSTGADGGRVVTLRVRPDTGTLSITMSADSGVVRSAVVDGRRVDRSRYRSRSARWSLEYVAPADSGFTLVLAIEAGSLPMLSVTSRRIGIPRLSGLRIPDRPPGTIPIQSGDITLVYRRVRL